AQPPGGLTSRTTQHEARALHAAAGAVAAVCPALASQAQRLARQLARRLVGLPATPGLVHGDFYARQVLLQGGGTVGLIDFDEAAYGDCTSDLANFLAHLEYEVLRGTLGRARAEAVGAALLEGYSGAGGAVTVQSLSHHVAARLLLLAPQPFRTFTSGWPTHTAALLERVAELAV
ncbi:MAG: phosphotransferase, partial [Chloroflexaceae bacterium]|nr:phosphotransferase [Chloroflexaceae bacterium]